MRILITFLTLFAISSTQAQDVELGLWGGVSLYSGDFDSDEITDYFKTIEPAGGILLRLNPADPLSVEFGVNLGRIGGEDGVTNNVESRKLNFRSKISEFSLKFNWNFLRLGNPRGTEVVPYMLAGGSVFHFNPETSFDGNWVELQPLGTEAQGVAGYADPYSLTAFSVMAGGGLKFIISKKMTIGLEFAGRMTNTDYLDDVTATEVNYLDVLTNGSLAASISNPDIKDTEAQELIYIRGGKFKDWFYMGGISFSFAFGGGDGVISKGIGCPTF